jgi:hypothetical protein
LLGVKFVFRTTEVLGPEYTSMRKPPYEGQVVTIVGFKPAVDKQRRRPGVQRQAFADATGDGGKSVAFESTSGNGRP